MDRLWQRKWRVTCGALDVSAIDLNFAVGKSLKPEPNTAALTLYNLSEESRNMLSAPGELTLLIEAGYANETDKPGQIYLGPVRSAVHTVDRADIVTTIESADSQKALGSSRFKLAVGPGAAPSVVLQAIAKSLGVKLGNLSQAAAKLAASGKVLFPLATSISGSSAKVLTDFCRSANLEWSVQDGELQILNLGAALDSQPYILNSDTGLVGSPSIDKDGVVTLQTLMLRGLRPGIRVVVDSRFVKGTFRIQECSYTGDTRADDWYIDMVCKPVKVK